MLPQVQRCLSGRLQRFPILLLLLKTGDVAMSWRFPLGFAAASKVAWEDRSACEQGQLRGEALWGWSLEPAPLGENWAGLF